MSDSMSDSTPDRTVCFCYAVPLSEIREAIRKGAGTLYDIQSETLACTGCRGCEWEVLEILQEMQAKTQKKQPV